MTEINEFDDETLQTLIYLCQEKDTFVYESYDNGNYCSVIAEDRNIKYKYLNKNRSCYLSKYDTFYGCDKKLEERIK